MINVINSPEFQVFENRFTCLAAAATQSTTISMPNGFNTLYALTLSCSGRGKFVLKKTGVNNYSSHGAAFATLFVDSGQAHYPFALRLNRDETIIVEAYNQDRVAQDMYVGFMHTNIWTSPAEQVLYGSK